MFLSALKTDVPSIQVRLINAEKFTGYELLTKNHSEGRINVDYDRCVSA
jgi:hypothetical protein